MCTVTFVPVKDKFYLTSNRDEKCSRAQALPPDTYHMHNGILVYPKDADAGGSWIAMHENGTAAVLLNGAFVKHTPLPPYKKSRGIIFLQIIAAASPVNYFQKINLSGIEPFTLILFNNSQLWECRWDALKKYSSQLKNYRPYIWSSVTLYTEDVVKKREAWFASFLNKTPRLMQQDILSFHQFTGDGDSHNDLSMNRDGQMLTVSITSIAVNEGGAVMKYTDLKDRQQYSTALNFTQKFTEA